MEKVRFNISEKYALKSGISDFKDLLLSVFNRRIEHFPVTVICTLEQFGRFCIIRNQWIQNGGLKGCNTFAALEAEIFEADENLVVDVS